MGIIVCQECSARFTGYQSNIVARFTSYQFNTLMQASLDILEFSNMTLDVPALADYDTLQTRTENSPHYSVEPYSLRQNPDKVVFEKVVNH